MNYQRTQIHQKKLSTYVKVLAPVAVILVWGFLWIMWAGSTPVNVEKTISIPKGVTVSNLTEHLKVNISGFRYKLWRMFFAPSIELQTGYFKVPEGTDTLNEVFEMLQNPTPSEEDILLLPGWHKGEMSEAFKKKNLDGDLLTEEQSLIIQFAGKYPFLAGKTSLEGFLMPDTYRITGSTTVADMVDKMLTNFNKRIYQPFLESGKPVDAFYDVLILASIVGEEEKSASQIGTVADILKKRLRQGWHIGADITVCYPELIPGSECQAYVNKYYSSPASERTNTYDTRTIVGLPPTPVASMTAAAFMATLNATAETPAWYYLHDNQGVIHTAISESEHEQNKSQYLR